MKKTKFLALVLVVAIMMMGAGYAYWTQDLTIENTISTGNLKVVFANQGLEVDDYMDNINSKIDLTDYNLNVDLKGAYPGADITISFDLDNEGTLGAHVRDFAIAEGSVNSGLVFVRSYKVGGADEVILAEDNTLATVLANLNKLESNKGIFVEKDAEVKLVLNLEIDPSADANLDQGTEDAITFTINAKVHQYNDN